MGQPGKIEIDGRNWGERNSPLFQLCPEQCYNVRKDGTKPRKYACVHLPAVEEKKSFPGAFGSHHISCGNPNPGVLVTLSHTEIAGLDYVICRKRVAALDVHCAVLW